MEQEPKCLFCGRSIKISQNLSEDLDQERKKKSKILALIFTKLCLLFHLNFPNKWSWDFKEEPFPFCKSCRREIIILCRLHDQLNIIQKQISKIVAKLSVLTIECNEKEDKVNERTNAKNSVNKPGDNDLKGNKTGNRYNYFRRGIILRYSPSLVLEVCRSDLTSANDVIGVEVVPEDGLDGDVPKDGNGIRICKEIFGGISWEVLRSSSGVTDVTDAPEERNVSKDGNGIKICEDVFETSGSCEGEVDNGFDPPTPHVPDVESGPVSPAGSLPVEDTIDDTNVGSPLPTVCTKDLEEEEISMQLPQPSSTRVLEICEDSTRFVRILPKVPTAILQPKVEDFGNAISAAERKPESPHKTGSPQTITKSVPRNSITKKPKLSSLSDKLPPSKVTWIQGKVFAYHSIKFRAEKDEISCLECEFKTTPDNTIYGRIKKHIVKSHIARPRKEGKIYLLDEATKTYTLNGFEFEEMDNHYRCSTCSALFKYPPNIQKRFLNIRNHILLVHMETEKRSCPICGKPQKKLSTHLLLSHPNESAKRMCEICGKEYKTQSALSMHRKIHQDPSEKKHQCDRCGKKFGLKFNLNSHMRTHTGEKPYICEKCGRRFAFRGVYQTHLASHEKIRPFACTLCEWTFGAKFLLTRHIKQVHEGIKPPPAKKRKKVVSDDDDTSSSSSSSE